MNQLGNRKGARSAWIRVGHVAAVGLCLMVVTACQQKMAQAPYFRAQEESDFFEDGRSARPLEYGTVARDKLAYDNPLMSGLDWEFVRKQEAEKKKDKDKKEPEAKSDTAPPEPPLLGAPKDVRSFVDAFPFELKESDVRRGMERYTIYCTPCHGALGDGKGKIVERGFLRPTAYYPLHDKDGKLLAGTGVSRGFARFSADDPRHKNETSLLLKDAPVGYYFEVITKGFGAMPDHAAQIPPADRWRIVAYIRTLQLSQFISAKDLTEAEKKALNEPKAAESKHHE
jgi:hypothetical protein